MIGDWYWWEAEGKKYHLQVTKDTFKLMDEDISNFQPIPLTPEILEKNGILYEKQSYYYVIEDNKDLECTYYIYQTVQKDWAIGVDTGAYDCSVFARIKYVHELQHALKLCGIDKEIMV
jgi:hypothetical protein